MTIINKICQIKRDGENEQRGWGDIFPNTPTVHYRVKKYKSQKKEERSEEYEREWSFFTDEIGYNHKHTDN
jgi:hypothetical protein